MDKAQALHTFWSGFGIPAYDQYSVPDDAQYPYITYEVATDSYGNTVPLTASLWYRDSSWEDISVKAEEVARALGEHGYQLSAVDGGYVWIRKGSVFAQRMNDPTDDLVKRMYLSVSVEFPTAF